MSPASTTHQVPTSLHLANNTTDTVHHRDLSWNQIKTMDSIFSTPERRERDVATKRKGFLDLPGELRNQIYSLVFAPATPELRLFPSIESLNSLGFLYTCRQIHCEARHLAYTHALCYTATNRWHRHDLVQMSQTYNRLPPMLQAFISSLELQTQWRLPHTDAKPGNWRFFDCFVDWAGWIWDCVELFSGVRALKIVHTWQEDMDGLSRLKYCLKNDMYLPVGPRANNAEPKNWRLETKTAGSGNKITKLFLMGMNERHGRCVKVECVPASQEDLRRYSERNYAWLNTQSRARGGS